MKAWAIKFLCAMGLLSSAPAFANIYVEGAWAHQNLALSNSITTAESLDVSKLWIYSAEVGRRKGGWVVGLRGEYGFYGAATGTATNDLTQMSVWAVGGLAIGSGRLSADLLGGVGYLVKNTMTLSGTSSDGTYSNTGLAALGALRLIFGLRA